MRTTTHPIQEQFIYITTIGRKTGLLREIEVWFVEREGRLYSLTEEPLRSNWLRNIIANANVIVRRGGRRWNAVGRVLDLQKEGTLCREVQELARQKYNWWSDAIVEFRQ